VYDDGVNVSLGTEQKAEAQQVSCIAAEGDADKDEGV
jgi:hypothetical protein